MKSQMPNAKSIGCKSIKQSDMIVCHRARTLDNSVGAPTVHIIRLQTKTVSFLDNLQMSERSFGRIKRMVWVTR